MNKNENSVRIQTSILNPYEKKALIWMAGRLPGWVTSDMLTWFSLFGAVVIAAGYVLTNYSPAWLWLSSLGFVMHWAGDSLDGTIARVRNQSRPLYGFYIDHNMDCITEFFIFGGMGLSAYMHFWMGLLMFCVYLAMEVYVMICAHLKNEFKLTYGVFGPTELRVLMVLLNTVWFFVEPLHTLSVDVTIGPLSGEMFSLDLVGVIVFMILCFLYFSSLIKDGKYFAKIDPLHKKQ
ncbi:MAG: CDP-alcohol phosphatidyltransferase family protein [Bacteroides sp.]|nr:CDP-alcohol phosphatidyltransferase family protein [Bacteroides sp.]MCM1447199.1 CDP-alcohol phosphatidyltransferase family protein [Bacteroides sp.]